MQPSSDQDVSPGVHGEILDGRDSLRLVRIRLALTLIAVAIIPLAAVAPIARAVLDDTRTGLEERLAAEADHAASEVRRELDGIRGTLEILAASEAVAAALAAPIGDPAAAPALADLRGLIERPSGVVAAVAVADPGGIHARAGSESTAFAGIPPAANRTELNLVPGSGSSPALEIVAPIPAATDGTPLGWVTASVRVERLIAWASPDAASAGRSVEIRDANGRLLAIVGPSSSINLPATVIDMAANGSETSQGEAAIGLPQLDNWHVVARAPLPVAAIPFPAVATLVGLLALLIGFIWWMARQIVRPAAELEAQRSRLHDLYETARDAALRDSLTGLGNHRAFQEAVTRMVDQTRRYGIPFSLVLLDIDEFKRINDTRGHATGDELLAEVGRLIRATVRQADAGYRIGGDEFALLLSSTDVEGAEATTRRLLSRGLEDRPGAQYRGPISFSAGVTACPAIGRTRVAHRPGRRRPLPWQARRADRRQRLLIPISIGATSTRACARSCRPRCRSSSRAAPSAPSTSRSSTCRPAGSSATRGSSGSARTPGSRIPARSLTPPRSPAASSTSIAPPSTSSSAAPMPCPRRAHLDQRLTAQGLRGTRVQRDSLPRDPPSSRRVAQPRRPRGSSPSVMRSATSTACGPRSSPSRRPASGSPPTMSAPATPVCGCSASSGSTR